MNKVVFDYCNNICRGEKKIPVIRSWQKTHDLEFCIYAQSQQAFPCQSDLSVTWDGKTFYRCTYDSQGEQEQSSSVAADAGTTG